MDYKKLVEQLEHRHSKKKFFLYEKDETYYKGNKRCDIDLYFSKEFEDIDFKKYDLKKTFNYYLLIKKNSYKNFKKADLKIQSFIYHLDSRNNYNCYLPVKYLAKSLKLHYSKKDIIYGSDKYVKLKLRALSNVFVSEFRFDFIDNFLNIDDFEVMAVPVTKKYTNMIYFEDHRVLLKSCNKIVELSDRFSVYAYVSLVYMELFEKTIESIKDGEKLLYSGCNYNMVHNCILYDNESQKEIYRFIIYSSIPNSLTRKIIKKIKY